MPSSLPVRRVSGAALLAALALVAPALAATTVGSSLRARADYSTSCRSDSGCTLLGSAAVARPGVVVRWRLRTATRGVVRLRVLRAGAGVSSGEAERLTRRHAPGRDTSYVFTTRQPVEAGDELALDVGPGAAAVLHRRPGGGAVTVFAPAIPDGALGGAGTAVSGAELLLSADVEPDADGDGFGDETQDNCPSIANDQTSNPCPSTPATPPPSGGDDSGDSAPPRTTGWRRHKHRRHRF